MEDQPRLVRRTYKLEKVIDTDGGERSILEATLEFDDSKGMFQVKSKLTTKQVSSNPARMKLIQEAKAKMENQLALKGMELRGEWESGTNDQPELPFDEPTPRERYQQSVAALKEDGVIVTTDFGSAVEKAVSEFKAEKKANGKKSNARQVAFPNGEADSE